MSFFGEKKLSRKKDLKSTRESMLIGIRVILSVVHIKRWKFIELAQRCIEYRNPI